MGAGLGPGIGSAAWSREKELIERRVILPLAQPQGWPRRLGLVAAPGDRAVRAAR